MRTGCHYLISVSVCVCVTLVVFTDCESSTRPISTNPGSMEAGEYGLTRGTCFFRAPCRGGRGRRAGMDFGVCFGWGGFLRIILFQIFFFFERTRPAASMRPPCFIYLSTITSNCTRLWETKCFQLDWDNQTTSNLTGTMFAALRGNTVIRTKYC